MSLTILKARCGVGQSWIQERWFDGAPGTYTFEAITDDGMRVYLDDVLALYKCYYLWNGVLRQDFYLHSDNACLDHLQSFRRRLGQINDSS